MARTDDLTGLPNRRAWDTELAREMAQARRRENDLSVAMVDLDRFKDYNDSRGHQAGDRLLKEAAGAWRSALRESDLLTRYGGEEFAIALPDCDAREAHRLIERLRAVTPQGESCSAGIATWDHSESAAEIVGRADVALYEAKQLGRDRAISH
jgi:diguanylate cyclase (GGDEF)-like protein